MREILFRGKRLDTDEWTRGCLVRPEGLINLKKTYILEDCTSVLYDGSRHAFGGFVEVDPETVGQFTGLLARGRRGIFEGDIVLDTATGEKYEILYNYSSFVAADKNRFFYSLPLDTSVGCEIIGNIYDNPELLRGERNGTA